MARNRAIDIGSNMHMHAVGGLHVGGLHVGGLHVGGLGCIATGLHAPSAIFIDSSELIFV